MTCRHAILQCSFHHALYLLEQPRAVWKDPAIGISVVLAELLIFGKQFAYTGANGALCSDIKR